jgi:hypothetical protein
MLGSLMMEIIDTDNNAALKCIAIINCHFALNDGEKRLLGIIVNEIRLAFELEGAVKATALQSGAAWAPSEWFW